MKKKSKLKRYAELEAESGELPDDPTLGHPSQSKCKKQKERARKKEKAKTILTQREAQ